MSAFTFAMTPVNSFGSYLSLRFSKRLESSSKTLRFASTDLTMSEGCTSWRSRSRSLCLKRKRSEVCESNLARASPPWALRAREPDHFSYFSSRDRIRSSRLGDWGAVVSLSELVGLGVGCRGGDAGGWTALRGLLTAGSRSTHGGEPIFDRLRALELLLLPEEPLLLRELLLVLPVPLIPLSLLFSI